MKKNWKVYDRLSEKKETGKGIYLLPQTEFKIARIFILPSIDEEDRRKSILQKLEERFIDSGNLFFLFYSVMEETIEGEEILCFYLEKPFSVSEKNQIECIIPGLLLGEVLPKTEIYLILDYGQEWIQAILYREGKIRKYTKWNTYELQEKEKHEIFDNSYETCNVILLGEYSQEEVLFWSEKFEVLSLTQLQILEVPSEIEIWHHSKRKGLHRERYLGLFTKGFACLLCLSVIIGFYLQYRIEQCKMELAELERNNRALDFRCQELEEEISRLQEQEEEELFEEQKYPDKISMILKEIYGIKRSMDIQCFEYLENGGIKLRVQYGAPSEYIAFLRSLLQNDFRFKNHDSLEKKKEEYLVELEIEKDLK